MDNIIYYAIGGVVAVYIGYFVLAFGSKFILVIAPFLAGLSIYNMKDMYPYVVDLSLQYGLKIPSELTESIFVTNSIAIVLITLAITLPILPFYFIKDI